MIRQTSNVRNTLAKRTNNVNHNRTHAWWYTSFLRLQSLRTIEQQSNWTVIEHIQQTKHGENNNKDNDNNDKDEKSPTKKKRFKNDRNIIIITIHKTITITIIVTMHNFDTFVNIKNGKYGHNSSNRHTYYNTILQIMDLQIRERFCGHKNNTWNSKRLAHT